MTPLPRLVVNISPLIHLAEAGLLALLQQAAASVWVPEPVAREIRTYGPDDPTAIALASHAWLEASSPDAACGVRGTGATNAPHCAYLHAAFFEVMTS